MSCVDNHNERSVSSGKWKKVLDSRSRLWHDERMKRELTPAELNQRRQAGIARAKKAGWYGNSQHGRHLLKSRQVMVNVRHNPLHFVKASCKAIHGYYGLPPGYIPKSERVSDES